MHFGSAKERDMLMFVHPAIHSTNINCIAREPNDKACLLELCYLLECQMKSKLLSVSVPNVFSRFNTISINFLIAPLVVRLENQKFKMPRVNQLYSV